MMTFLVGPDEVPITVHETHLVKSPVLTRMCQAPFLESSEGVVRMRNDDPVSIGCIVRYLYRDDFEVRCQRQDVQEPPQSIMDDSETINEEDMAEVDDVIPVSDPEALDLLAGVYITAEEY